jgi:hypothetical protein
MRCCIFAVLIYSYELCDLIYNYELYDYFLLPERFQRRFNEGVTLSVTRMLIRNNNVYFVTLTIISTDL